MGPSGEVGSMNIYEEVAAKGIGLAATVSRCPKHKGQRVLVNEANDKFVLLGCHEFIGLFKVLSETPKRWEGYYALCSPEYWRAGHFKEVR